MFIPRHPVVEDQFCKFAETTMSGGCGATAVYAGAVCYLDNSQVDSIVRIYAADEGDVAFGFLMQEIKVDYHAIHPVGYMLPGDMGSSTVIAQPKYDSNGVINGTVATPVGIAHLGIWDTTCYYSTGALNAGTTLGVRKAANSELSNIDVNTVSTDCAKVVAGANATQVAGNVAGTTLYPIRVKLVI